MKRVILDDARLQIEESVLEARREWVQALNFFENASDPDLVDMAIFDLEGARRKYEYMLKQARILLEEDTRVGRVTGM